MTDKKEVIETQAGIHVSIEEQLDEHLAEVVSGEEYDTEGSIEEQLSRYACN